MNKNIKGFTLIELLVVIAIIGILTAVILPSLQASRDKGKVAAMKSEMDSMKKTAEVFNSDNGNSYTGMFANGSGADIATSTIPNANVQTLLSSIANRTSDGMIYGTIVGNEYAIYGRLPGTSPTTLTATDIWCIDSTGKSEAPSVDAINEFTAPVSVCW